MRLKSVNFQLHALAPLNNTDVLQFISDEEGRIRFKPISGTTPASFVNDYFIRDHLGNVRVGITDESQQDIYPAATGETASKPVNGVTNTPQNYEAQYYRFNPRDFVSTATLPWYSSLTGGTILNENDNGMPANNDPFSSTGSTSTEVFQLCGNTTNNLTGDNFGLGITLKVMAGDQVSIYGSSFWHGSLQAGSYPVSAVISSLLNAFGSSSAVTTTGREALDGSVFNTASSSPTASQLLPLLNNSSSQPGGQAPYAGINWIVFDDQFRPVSVGFDPVSGTSDNIKNHQSGSSTLPVITIPKNGYIYVYVSNQSNINVYFDNLQVVQTRGPMLEETHYYPDGLIMAGISDKAWNKLQNNYHYQGNEIQNQEWNDGSGLEEDDFNARFYDPQLGRWNTQDPAGQYASPYLGMGNNWMNGTDPNGQWFGIDDIIASFVGGVLNLGSELLSGNVHNLGQGLEYFGVGAAAGESGLYGGPTASGAVAGAGNALIGGGNLENVIQSGFMGVATGALAGGIEGASISSNDGFGWDDVLDWAKTGALRGMQTSVLSDISGGGQLSFSQIWRSAASGAALGVAQGYLGTPSDEGGEGLKDTHIGSMVYSAFTSIGKSVALNWSNGDALFSKVNVTIGPATLSFGKGQTLFQPGQNVSLLGNVANYGVSTLIGSDNIKWGFTSAGAIWTGGATWGTNGGVLLSLVNGLNSSNLMNKIFSTVLNKNPGDILSGQINPGDGIITNSAYEDQW
jgi:RHS repeat-associated protein